MTNRPLASVHPLRSRSYSLYLAVLAIISFVSCGASSSVTMVAPKPGTVLTGTSVTFRWSGGSRISDYKLSVGSANGTWDIYSADLGTSTSATVSGFKPDGKTVYVNLAAKDARTNRWTSRTYTYTDPAAAPGVSVAIAPQTVTLSTGATQTLNATVTGSSDTSVGWSTTGGTITGTGNSVSYTAPSVAGTYTITASSNADKTKSATAMITVTVPQVSISITPVNVSLTPGATQNFSASVSGTANTTVTWSASGGILNPSGLTAQYTAPSATGTYTVTVTSAADTSKTATASVTVTSGTQVSCAAMSLGQVASLNGMRPFPAGNAWNQDVSTAAVDPNSSTIINFIGANTTLHSDFGSGTYDGASMGIPYVTVDSSQPNINLAATSYPEESDVSPMPIPPNAPIEGFPNPGDNHVIVLDKSNCYEYDLYQGSYTNGAWSAGSSAIWDLQNGEMRPYTWTSADAAGLPIFPGLVRYDEVASGAINHAIRFTVPRTKSAFVVPASHWAGTDSTSPIPMGMRIRLKANFDVSSYSATNQVILNAMKKYGLILADNGSAIYISGTPDSRWNNDDLHKLTQVTAANFEVVNMGTVYNSTNVPHGAAPTINSLSASASNVSSGSPVTLSWNVSGASYLYISPVVGPVRGNSITFSPTVSASYVLTATNQYGRTTATVTVNVQ